MIPAQTHRQESDSIGRLDLPIEALFGIHTARALENFPITGVPISHFPSFVTALALVKQAATQANLDLGLITADRAEAVIQVCQEIVSGAHHQHFVVDMMQGGAGTSTNMNANEVIANLALQRLGHAAGSYEFIHPNDHVNLGQSTNDVYPTAIRLAVLANVGPLCEALQMLRRAFCAKAQEFADVHKVGRTQLQDAVPMSLGLEFQSYADTISEDIDRLHQLGLLLTEVNLGGTAIGTGVNTHKEFGKMAVKNLAQYSGFPFKQAHNLVEASSDLGAFVTFSGVLKRVGVKLSKICNDLRLLSSGPRAGFGEIILPPVQAGSSIMPGKVNPVIPEVVNQVCFQLVGNDLTITMAAEAGQLQLNAMEPVVAFNILESMRILTNSIGVLTDKCVSGITADTARCVELLENSLVLATALAPHIGYDAAAKIAKTAQAERKSISQAARETNVLAPEKLEDVLRVADMIAVTP